jgi:hypothetical protein
LTHDIAPATLAAAQSSVTAPVILVKLEFAEGNLCLHTGLGNLAYNGDTYTGAAGVAFIRGASEDSDTARSTMQLGLRGVPSDIISIALNSHYQGRPVTIMDGRLNPASMQLVGAPWVVRRGLMDTMDIQSGSECVVSLQIESEQAQWDRAVTRRYTDADQQSRYPGDRFFEFVERAVGQTIYWGSKGPA